MIIMGLFYVAFEKEIEIPKTKLSGIDRLSPPDHIKEENIHVYSDRVIIEIQNPEWATFTPTKSMDPVIDVGANSIQIVPQNESIIGLGDIASYESEYATGTIIHRIVYIDKDELGTYYHLKGDNNILKDPGKIRFNQIRRITVGIIY
jgi:hypothetical protein